MKKAFFTFTCLFTLLSVVFLATVASTGLEHTGNSFEVQNAVGDPAAAQNVQVSMTTVMSQQLHWNTTLTLGAQPKVDTNFRFTPEKEIPNTAYNHTQLAISTGTASVWYEDILSYWKTDRPDRSPYEAVILDVCSRAPANGMPYTETVTLSDYLDFYPVYLDHSCSDLTCWYVPVDLSAVLSIPIPDDLTAEVTVTKELDGSVFQYSLSCPETPYTWTDAVWFDGAYYVTIPADHLASLGEEDSATPGVYRIPLITGADGSQTVDMDHITLKFPFQSPVESIHLVQAGSKFLLVSPPTQDAPGQVTVVDTNTWELLQQFPLEASAEYSLNVEDDHLVYLSTQDNKTHITAWTVDYAGMYVPAISAPIPDSISNFPFCTVSLYQNGHLYTICNAWSSGISSFDVGVFDHSGLLYYATYIPNQSRDTLQTAFPLWLTEYPLGLTKLPA